MGGSRGVDLQPNYALGGKAFVGFGDPNFKACTYPSGGALHLLWHNRISCFCCTPPSEKHGHEGDSAMLDWCRLELNSLRRVYNQFRHRCLKARLHP